MPLIDQITATQVASQLRAFDMHLLTPSCIVYPAAVRAEYPDTAEGLLVFADRPYYQLSVDDRSQVAEELRLVWQDTEHKLMSCLFDERQHSSTAALFELAHQGLLVQFDFSEPGAPLAYVGLANGVFYVDIASYFARQVSA